MSNQVTDLERPNVRGPRITIQDSKNGEPNIQVGIIEITVVNIFFIILIAIMLSFISKTSISRTNKDFEATLKYVLAGVMIWLIIFTFIGHTLNIAGSSVTDETKKRNYEELGLNIMWWTSMPIYVTAILIIFVLVLLFLPAPGTFRV